MEGPVRTLGCLETPHKEPRCWSGPDRTCATEQARLSASLVNAVSGPSRLDWSRRCVPLTRGLRVPWGILCGSLWVSGDLLARHPGSQVDRKGLVLYFFNRVIYVPLKVLYHLYEMGFWVRILLFRCVRVSRACCGRIVGV